MSYRVWIDPPAIAELKTTPGNVRQRLKRAMLALGTDPRPSGSKELDWPPERLEPRRLKLGNWRIVYAAVRKRPPYDYGDISALLQWMG